MNSIIGTLVNGEINNKTKKNQNRVNFCSSFSFYVWLIGKTIISSKIVYVSRENMENKENNCPKTELTFVVVLVLCLADRKDYHF